ncbi:early flowering 3 family protein [Striga asiatica]|uniref:Early flowering 3 family protein n=1 Tax=Striga asiatica TaxID=4170 RepID=A0A5A7QI31_STRAF|nr:early flowering 3 family protein [Striga asiatica]
MKGVKDVEKEVTCFEEDTVPYHRSKSLVMLPRPASLSNVSISKQKVLPNSTDIYSHCSVGLISKRSLRKTNPFILDPMNDERVNLTMETLKYENIELYSILEENRKISENNFASVYGNNFSKVLLKSEAVTDGMFERVKRKRCDISPQLYPGSGDCNKPGKIEWIMKESPEEKYSGNSDEKRDMPDSRKEESVQSFHLTPDDVVKVIGQRLFQKARHTILDQQKTFSGQILELHMLTKVQRCMARSQQKLPQKNFNASKPPIQFPPMDNLLYANSLDQTKINALKSNTKTVNFPPNLPTNPTIIPSTKANNILSPYIFHPPTRNQWLVPIKSPSEGLVYKPFFPSSGFALGNEIDQGYIRHCTVPPVYNPSAENISSKEEIVEKDCLALFPMTPSSELVKDANEGSKSGVIRVVPHNQKSAPESAVRIFESLQEERRLLLRLSSCT